MAEKKELEKCNFWNFRSPRDVDLGSGHAAYRHAQVIDLYLHTKFHENRKKFLWTDVRTTYLLKDGHFPSSNVIRSTRRSQPKNGLHACVSTWQTAAGKLVKLFSQWTWKNVLKAAHEFLDCLFHTKPVVGRQLQFTVQRYYAVLRLHMNYYSK